jgi:hypothetical protein
LTWQARLALLASPAGVKGVVVAVRRHDWPPHRSSIVVQGFLVPAEFRL